MNASLEAKAADLDRFLRSLETVVVAYSGGVDSALVALAAHRALGEDALAVTAVSPSLSRRERRQASELARRMGFSHREVTTHELRREEYARNAADRCFWCKTELFDVLSPIAAQRNAAIAVGTNVDDLGDHRPGIAAARLNAVAAPLVEAGLTKNDVRALAAAWGLPIAEKPAAPCLASRFAYGVRVTEEGLRRIDEAEEAVRSLGFEVLRVRDHGDLARVEVPEGEIEKAAALADAIARTLRGLGFRYVTLDLSGFRSGSLNDVLQGPSIRRPERSA
ncbi:MAG: ATP-dependent sacrificial sulfur transferase LarE [Actinobacteria bacterium]|nr:ATP-dependent sacrificial sulfur transferase LarE [Actinomycetota bacterium]